MKTKTLLLLLLACSSFLGQVSAQYFEIYNYPKALQLYQRDLTTNEANVFIDGALIFPGVSKVQLQIYRNGSLTQSLDYPLFYTGGSAYFSFNPSITAELANYSFELYAFYLGTPYLIRKAQKVVAGDAYIITGQSNSVANSYSGSANAYQNIFIRSYGLGGFYNGLPADNTWYYAEGDGAYTNGAVGQWGLVLARNIVNDYQVPVAIINHGVGGQAITYFQRNDANPKDAGTNYGTMLQKADNSSLRNSFRGIFWYQGESDAFSMSDASNYFSRWTALYNDWQEDFPSLEKIYVMQIRLGCFQDLNFTNYIQETLRTLPDVYTDVEVMSTTNLSGHDGCHFAFNNGYRELGERLYELVARDLYGAPPSQNIDPPNIDYAYYSNPSQSEISLIMRDTDDDLIWQNGMENNMNLRGAPEFVTSGTVAGNKLILTLSGPSSALGINYFGNSGAGPTTINARGVGLLTFWNIPVIPYSPKHSTIDPADLVLYPNPVSENLYLNMEESKGQDLSIEIKDIEGRVIKQVSPSYQVQFTIDVSNLAPGMYFLNIGRQEVHKFIKF